jgi:hypothetical protein
MNAKEATKETIWNFMIDKRACGMAEFPGEDSYKGRFYKTGSENVQFLLHRRSQKKFSSSPSADYGTGLIIMGAVGNANFFCNAVPIRDISTWLPDLEKYRTACQKEVSSYRVYPRIGCAH